MLPSRVTLATIALALLSICVSGQQSPAANPKINAVMNVASYGDIAVSPGEMVVIFGTGLGPSTLTHLKVDGNGRLVSELEGVTVLANGISCPLIYVSQYQLSAMMPYSIAELSTVKIEVLVNGARSNLFEMPVAPSAPGIFTTDASGHGIAAMNNSDGTMNSPATPAKPGNWFTFYLTGEGNITPAGIDGKIIWSTTSTNLPVKVSIAGYEASVLYAGSAPGNVNGFAQINAIVPDDLPYGGELPLRVQIGDAVSRPDVTIAVAGTPGPKPAAPTNVSATGLGNGAIQLSWSSSGTQPNIFLIERSADGSSFKQIATVDVGQPTFIDLDIAGEIEYRYRIKGLNRWGLSPYSGVVSYKRSSAVVKSPQLLQSSAVSPSAVDLTWQNQDAATTLVAIERQAPDGSTFSEIARIPVTTSFQVTGLAAATTYSFRVRAVASAGLSNYSNVTTVTTQVASPPPATVLISVSPSSTTLRSGESQQFAATVSGSENTGVSWVASPQRGSVSSTGLYTAPGTVTSTETVTITARSTSDPTKTATATVTLAPTAIPHPTPESVSFFTSSQAPSAITDDTARVVVGIRFTSSVPGNIAGIRYYKWPSNTGTHVATLWSAEGAALGEVTFTGESASGWQQADFSTPIKIAADTEYVASYVAPMGQYAEDQYFAWPNLNASPLQAVGSSPGVYTYTSTNQFPTNIWRSSNYWVDVAFVPDSGAPIPPPAQTYTISGTVSGSTATLSLSGASTSTTNTNASGIYSFSGLKNGNYVVIPTKTGFTFSPSTTTVSIESAPVTGINFIAVSVPPSARTVTLSWNPSLSSDVSGYYIYRSATSGGPYSKVSPSLIRSTSFVDLDVVGGQTYYYVATTIDGNGAESTFSNQATAYLN